MSKQLWKVGLLAAIIMVPFGLRAASAPLYTTLKRTDGAKAYFERGIVGTSNFYSCDTSLITISCFKIEKVPAETSLAESGAPGIKFANADKSVLMAFTTEQGVTTALFYRRNDYSSYKTIVIPFNPSRAIFTDNGKTVIMFGAEKSKPSLFSIDLQTFAISPTQTFDRSAMSAVKLSPDGKWLSYYIAATSKNKKHTLGLYSIDLKKHFTVDTTNKYWDLLSEANSLSAFSADGNYFSYLDDRDGYQSAYIVALSNKMTSIRGTKIGGITNTTNDIIFAGNTLAYIHNNADRYLWSLSLYDPSTKKTTTPIEDISYSENLAMVYGKILVYKSTTHGFDPILIDPTSQNISTLAFSSENWSSADPKQADTIARTVVSKDGVNGVLLSKSEIKNATTLPLVIWLHGGPYRQSAKHYHSFKSYGGYDWALEELVETGQARVLKIDYRGSFGFGLAKAKAVLGEVGRGDVSDILGLLSSVKGTYKTDNVYTMGNSYGGYLALRAEVGNPKTIQGALSINGVTNWAEFLTHLNTSIFNLYFGGVPDQTNKAAYARASIVSRIKNLTDTHKTIIIQGLDDSTVLPSQAPLLNKALTDAAKQSDMVLLEGENHVFTKPSSLELVCSKLFELTGVDKTGRCSYAYPKASEVAR